MKFILPFSISVLFFFPTCAQTEKLKITKLRENFYIFTTYNLYKGVPVSSNGMYLLTDTGAVLFDTPWDSTQFQPLLDSIEKRHQKKVVLCIATHGHEDRTGGLEFFNEKGIKTFTSYQTDEISKTRHEKRAKFHFRQDTTFRIANHTFQTFYPGEGHTKDNIVLWFEKEKILYGGCFIKSTEAKDLGNISEANIKAWPGSLNAVKQKFIDPAYIITGHQDWTSTRSISHTLDLLKEQQNK
jgi:metallo-beta-lactamase class B